MRNAQVFDRAALLLLLAFAVPASAAEFSAKVVDRLGRPVAGAVVELYWLKSVSDDDVREISVLKLVSDRNGVIKGTYDDNALPAGEEIWAEVSKDGYSGYSTTALLPEYVLERKFGPADLSRIAALDGKAQVDELRELLAGDFGDSGVGLFEQVFVQEHRFRPALRELAQDAKVGEVASELLAFIGVPEDVRLVVEHAPRPSRGDSFENRWAYGAVRSLLEPTTEKEWAFLRGCALNEYDDLWVDSGAIETLKLIASPKSLEILKEVEKANSDRASEVETAIRYIQSKPPSLSDEDIVAAGKRVAQAIRIGSWKENKQPQYSEKGDKALVDCEFIDGRDLLVYTATFHKVDGRWKLRGVRETMQALLAQEPESGGVPDATPPPTR